ncbi:MAG: InlB B-repeat-containing protein [Treponema sp.]|jgi:uncharacterized repeat protein (TIGR02543 family)|nr:InlB B-repeat-containing protein [Treponema sp.]
MTNKKFLVLGMLAIALAFGLVFAGCDTDGGGEDATSYTVGFDAGDGSGTPPASQTVNSGQSITLPGQGTMTAPSGKSFNGWSTGGQNYTAGANYTVNGNVTFTAQWQTTGGGGTTTYTVDFNAGDGSGTPPASQTVNSGQGITLPGQGTMTAPTGKSFNGWSTGGQNYTTGANYTVNGNVTFTAQWQTTGGGSTTTYTVDFNAGDGSGTPPASQTKNSGQSITLPGQGDMTAPTGKSFNGWSTGGQNYTAGASYTVNGNITFTAQWTQNTGTQYTVTFNVNGGSSVAPQTGSSGTQITLPSTSRSGYTFNGWFTSASGGTKVGNAGASYTVTSTTTLYAQWTTTVSVPSAPTGVTATGQSQITIRISWNAVSGATSYHVYRASSSSGSYTEITGFTGTTSTSYDDITANTATATTGKTWYYKVTAENSAGESALSSAAYATTPVAAPNEPYSMIAQPQSTTSIKLTWDTAIRAVSYKLSRSTSSTGTFVQVYSGSNTTYTDTGLIPNTAYYYKVVSVNSGGESAATTASTMTQMQ